MAATYFKYMVFGKAKDHELHSKSTFCNAKGGLLECLRKSAYYRMVTVTVHGNRFLCFENMMITL